MCGRTFGDSTLVVVERFWPLLLTHLTFFLEYSSGTSVFSMVFGFHEIWLAENPTVLEEKERPARPNYY